MNAADITIAAPRYHCRRSHALPPPRMRSGGSWDDSGRFVHPSAGSMSHTSHPSRGSHPFGDLVARSYPALRRMAAAKTFGSHLAPSSIVQDTLVRILRLPQSPTEQAQLEAAAWKIMHWIITDRLRSDKARANRESEPRLEPRTAREDDRCDALLAALEQLAALSPLKAEVLTLVALCDQTHEQVATLLNISERTVQRHLAFARDWIGSVMPPAPDA